MSTGTWQFQYCYSFCFQNKNMFCLQIHKFSCYIFSFLSWHTIPLWIKRNPFTGYVSLHFTEVAFITLKIVPTVEKQTQIPDIEILAHYSSQVFFTWNTFFFCKFKYKQCYKTAMARQCLVWPWPPRVLPWIVQVNVWKGTARSLASCQNLKQEQWENKIGPCFLFTLKAKLGLDKQCVTNQSCYQPVHERWCKNKAVMRQQNGWYANSFFLRAKQNKNKFSGDNNFKLPYLWPNAILWSSLREISELTF